MNSRTTASRPDKDVERKNAGSGPVKTSFMSPEELEDYRARTGYKEPQDKPEMNTSLKLAAANEELREKAEGNKLTEEQEKATRKPLGHDEPDRQDFLKWIAEGRSISAYERVNSMPFNRMHTWLKKWGLSGIKADRAKELLTSKDDIEDLRKAGKYIDFAVGGEQFEQKRNT